MKREYEYRVHVVVDGHCVVDCWATDADAKPLPAVSDELFVFGKYAMQDYRERQQAAAEDAADAKLEELREMDL